MKTILYYFWDFKTEEVVICEGSLNTSNMLVSVGAIQCPNGLVSVMAAFDGKKLLGEVRQ